MARTSTSVHSASRLVTLSIFGICAALTLGGCVSTEEYNAMKLNRDEAVAESSSAQEQAKTATARYDELNRQFGTIRNGTDNKDAMLANQASTIADLKGQLADVTVRYQQAVDLAGKAGTTVLPPQLTNELTAVAEQNPGLVDFDSSRGLIKFKSDVTFGSGSAIVTDQAKAVIDRVAQILNTGVAAQYDLMVVGHTDAQPVSNPATIKAGNLDNWYLSVHRAIEVRRELHKLGVADPRIEVAGFADQRPVAPNDTTENKSRNRRVEVLILPTATSRAAMASEQPSPAVPAAAHTLATPINKDTPSVPPGPTGNK